jgi:Rieske 2Fe-2S family protein
MSASVAESNLTLRYPELGTGPVPTDIYWRPEFYQRELAAIYRRAWLCIGRVEQINAVGDFFIKDIPTFNLGILVVRSRDNRVRAFHNVCQHRGNHIELQRAGNCKRFTCPFHGWTYDLEGKLAGVPDSEAFYNLERSTLGLPPVNLDIWEGFIFINLAATPEQSLREILGQQGEDLVGYPFHKGTEVFEYEGTIKTNWKCMVDSFVETYPVPILHKQSVTDTLAGPDNPFGRLIDVRLKGLHRTSSVVGNLGYQPNPVQGLAFANAPGPSITSGSTDETTVLPRGLNETRAPN